MVSSILTMSQRHSRISQGQGTAVCQQETREMKRNCHCLPLVCFLRLAAVSKKKEKTRKLVKKNKQVKMEEYSDKKPKESREKCRKRNAKEMQPSARIVIEKISLEGITRAWRGSLPVFLYNLRSLQPTKIKKINEFNKDTRGEFILYFV